MRLRSAKPSDARGHCDAPFAEIVESFPVCYPLTELSVIRHEPDNRFLILLPVEVPGRRVHRDDVLGARDRAMTRRPWPIPAAHSASGSAR